jgi:NADH dehydrogenase
VSGVKTRVVILGGGFAGVYSAMALERLLRRAERDQFEISLVSRENYMVFQPMLPEVISGAIDMLHVISPIRRMAKRTHLHTREIECIDLANKIIRLAPGYVPRQLTLPFDHLVLALGTTLEHAKVPGMQEHGIDFKYLGDALRLRNHLVHVLEEAEIETDPLQRTRLLTFVVAGGGFSGVECIAEMNDFLRSAIQAYPHVRPEELRVVLLQSAERILPEMPERLAAFAHRVLERRGVEIRLLTKLKCATAEAAIVQCRQAAEPELLPTRTIVATVPVTSHPILRTLGVELRGGKLPVTPELELVGHTGVWALGDCASIPLNDGTFAPPTAQHALRQANVCARNILATYRGTKRQNFAFGGLGKLASLGRRSAVAEVLGVKLSGLPAWLLWRAVYLSKFPGWERKVRILADWLLHTCLPRDITQVRIFNADPVSREHFEAGQTLFNQQDFGDKVYFVVSGEAEVFCDGQLVATVGPGSVIGEIALLSDRPRSATVRARTSLDAVSVSRPAFRYLLEHVPGVRTTMESIMQRHLGKEG